MDRKLFVMRFIFGMLFCLCSSTAGAEPGSGAWEGVENMMSDEEFQAAGLNRLSPAELSTLNQWLLHFIARDAQQLAKSDETIRELQNTPVRHRIAGSFRGWDGDTVFILDNGQVWKQRLSGRYVISLEQPEVEISRNLLGFYELRVVQTGRKVGVSRVK